MCGTEEVCYRWGQRLNRVSTRLSFPLSLRFYLTNKEPIDRYFKLIKFKYLVEALSAFGQQSFIVVISSHRGIASILRIEQSVTLLILAHL